MHTVEIARHTPGHSDTHQKPSAYAASFVSAYLFTCLLCFVAAYFGLNHKEAGELRPLRNSTLLYASSDHTSAKFAEWASTHLHMRTVDLLSPGAGETVYRLTSARKATSPTLVIPSTNGAEVVSGPAAVDQALQPITARTTPIGKAKWALAFMAGLILLAIIFETELAKVVAFLPIIGVVAIGALWGHCLNCSSSGSTLSALAPVFGLIYLGGGGSILPPSPVPSLALHDLPSDLSRRACVTGVYAPQ